MARLTDEHWFYHACAITQCGSHEQLAKLITKHGSWEKAWEHLKGAHPEITKEAEEKRLETLGVSLILQSDPTYPPLIKEIEHAPFGIYVRGTLPSPETFTFAVIGTRNATEPSKELAEEFSGALAKKNIVIVSGLALGIDASAHHGCLEAGGTTIAVVATGLDQYYPKTNESLGKRIIENGGALISEYPPGVPALPHQFLERNRIVSGLSKGVLVIEAPARSGSLATARFALDQNRDVFVIPGPAKHPNFKGSHELIRQGAELVTTPEDILTAYGIEGSPTAETEEMKSILEAISSSKKPVSIDKIIELTHLEARVVMQTLTALVTRGTIVESDLGYASRK